MSYKDYRGVECGGLLKELSGAAARTGKLKKNRKKNHIKIRNMAR